MKKETIIIAAILTMWIPILFSYIQPSDVLTWFTNFLFVLVFTVGGTYAIFKYFEAKLFVPITGRYWIKAGRHYADGLFWSNIRNVKMFFFKKEVEFWYRLSPEAIQDDQYQKNKIFGITSVLYRRNSIRETFANRPKFGTFDVYKYTYRGKINFQTITDLNRKPGVWYHTKLKPQKMIWFGFYHFPYHGGRIASKKNYSIDISFREPS